MNEMSGRPPSEAPEGFMLNAIGSFVPTKYIKPEHLLEDQLVNEMTARAWKLEQHLAEFRERAFEDVDNFLSLLAEKYGAKRGGTSGNTTLQSFDGLAQIKIATGDFLTFGPELQIAKSLVDECLSAWTAGANDKLLTIVNDAFDVGKEGKLRVDRILALRRLEIDDPTWQRAMTAIGNAVRTTHSKRYVRFYQRASHEAEWSQVNLSLSRASS